MRQFASLLLTLAFALAFANTTVADEGRRVELHGTIVAVGDAGIVLRTDRGDVRIHVTERTHITRNGERVRLSSLQPRDQARVRGWAERTRHGVRITAHTIQSRGR